MRISDWSSDVCSSDLQLSELGAVDDRRRLTPTGRTMAKLPVDVKLARMLVAAQAHGCLHEMLAIASFLGIQDPRERPADQRAAADAAHAQFRDAKSEFRSEEHTSELQSLMRNSYAVFCLKKKTKSTTYE